MIMLHPIHSYYQLEFSSRCRSQFPLLEEYAYLIIQYAYSSQYTDLITLSPPYVLRYVLELCIQQVKSPIQVQLHLQLPSPDPKVIEQRPCPHYAYAYFWSVTTLILRIHSILGIPSYMVYVVSQFAMHKTESLFLIFKLY